MKAIHTDKGGGQLLILITDAEALKLALTLDKIESDGFWCGFDAHQSVPNFEIVRELRKHLEEIVEMYR